MNLAANTVQAASTVRADVKNQVTEGVSALGQFNDFLLNYAPDIIAAIIIFIILAYGLFGVFAAIALVVNVVKSRSSTTQIMLQNRQRTRRRKRRKLLPSVSRSS